jgi:murein DD-endopeptidase MepM/ murein hydrolase activator NlpD
VRSGTRPSKGRKSSKGRHKRPSQVQKVAKRAGMAAPAIAVSGALAAAPQLLAAAPAAAAAQAATQATHATQTTQATAASLDSVQQQADQAQRMYTVRSGDTLSGIAQRFYDHASDWVYLAHVNKSTISNPNLIITGEQIAVPTDPPASVRNGTYAAKHAKASSSSTTELQATNTADTTSTSATQSSSSSASSVTAQVDQDVANGNNLLAIGQFLVGNGYSKAAAAGIASCIDGESGGNPESVGDGGGGLIGWTPLSSAQPNANVVTGNVEQDMLTQLNDILFYNSNEIGQSAVNQLNSISDPVAAADFYSQNFERPAVTDSDVVPSVAQQIFSDLGG